MSALGFHQVAHRLDDVPHRVQVLPVKDFNTLALLKNRKLVLTEAAFDEIQKKEETSGGSD